MPSADAPPAVTAPQVPSLPAFATPSRPQTYVYIVSSEAEATQLLMGMQDASSLESDVDTRHILVVDSPDYETALSMLEQEIEQATGGRPTPVAGGRTPRTRLICRCRSWKK